MSDSSESSSSLDVSLLPTPSEDEATSKFERWNVPCSTTKALAGISFVLLVVVGIHQGSFQARNNSGMTATFNWDNSTSDETSYGVDVSWPIHQSIRSDSKHIFGAGVRHQAYLKHLNGCRKRYAHIKTSDPNSCDNYEFQRMLMNKRQPQSMEVSFSNKCEQGAFDSIKSNTLYLVFRTTPM